MRFHIFASYLAAVYISVSEGSAKSALTASSQLQTVDLQLLEANEALLREQETMYLNKGTLEQLRTSSDGVNLNIPKYNILRYEVSKRDSITFKQLDYVMRNHPKSVILFKDTNTALLPEETDIMELDMIDGNKLKEKYLKTKFYSWNEYELLNKSSRLDDDLLPLTSCLSFSKEKGGGSVSIIYELSVGVTDAFSNDLDYNLPTMNNITSSLTFTFGLQASKTAAFSGTHSCDTTEGKALRLFYKLGTIDFDINKRAFVIDKFQKKIYNSAWSKLGHLKMITGANPIYYCVTEDMMDLNCDCSWEAGNRKFARLHGSEPFIAFS